jgi:hypothetical protein
MEYVDGLPGQTSTNPSMNSTTTVGPSFANVGVTVNGGHDSLSFGEREGGMTACQRADTVRVNEIAAKFNRCTRELPQCDLR